MDPLEMAILDMLAGAAFTWWKTNIEKAWASDDSTIKAQVQAADNYLCWHEQLDWFLAVTSN